MILKWKQPKQVIMTFLVLVGVTLLCRLGFWQLARAQDKQTLIAIQQLAKKNSILTNKTLVASSSSLPSNGRYIRVALKGEFDNQHFILLDNQTHQGRAGYHVLQPFKLTEQQSILVNRGWVALGKSRYLLPTLPPITGQVTIEGYLDFAYRNPFIKQAIESSNLQWPLRMQQVDVRLLTELLGKNFYPLTAVLEQPQSYCFTPLSTQGPYLSPERHYGYAFQWFALATTLLCCYLYYVCFRKGSTK